MKRKIKILFTIPNFDTAGSGKVLLNIASGLNIGKFEAEIMCQHDRGDFFQEVLKSGIKVHVVQYTKEFSFTRAWMNHCWQIAKIFRELRPDIIHSFHYASEFSEPVAARLAGVKWIFTKKNMAWGNKAWIIRSKLATKIIATNHKIKDQFYHGKDKVQVIYSGVDTKNFHFAQEFTTSSKKFVVVGNVSAIKGTQTIVDAFLKFSEHYVAQLVFVGPADSDYAIKIKESLKGKKYSERIRFMGKCADVREHLSSAFCLIMGSDRKGEGGPLALLEAMASGILVIGSRVPGIEEQLSHFQGLLFEPNNSDALVQRMKEIFQMPEQDILTLRHKLRQEVENRFSLQGEIFRHESLYLSLMGQKGH